MKKRYWKWRSEALNVSICTAQEVNGKIFARDTGGKRWTGFRFPNGDLELEDDTTCTIFFKCRK